MKGRFFISLTLLLLVATGFAATAQAYRYQDSSSYSRSWSEHSRPTAIRVYVDNNPHTRYDHIGTRNNYVEQLTCSRNYVQFPRCRTTLKAYTERFGSNRNRDNYVRVTNGRAYFTHNKRTDNIEGRHYLYSKHRPLPDSPKPKPSYSDVVFSGDASHAKVLYHRQG